MELVRRRFVNAFFPFGTGHLQKISNCVQCKNSKLLLASTVIAKGALLFFVIVASNPQFLLSSEGWTNVMCNVT